MSQTVSYNAIDTKKTIIAKGGQYERINTFSSYVRSPLNYIGGKYRLLKQILPLFPKNINTFVDLFAGGANVGLNVIAKQIICNDNLYQLIDLYTELQRKNIEDILEHISNRITLFKLSTENVEGYKELRKLYNSEKNPLDLFVLTAYSFNHQIRFNNNHDYNNPFGRNRSCFNESMKYNLVSFVERINEQNVLFVSKDFSDFEFADLCADDFVYCDPPYLITTGTYNDGKRGFKGWSEKEEKELLFALDLLNERGVRFALSNVLEHKGKSNDILKEWVFRHQHHVNYVKKSYSNSSYNTLNRAENSSLEVLITNYKPNNIQNTLF